MPGSETTGGVGAGVGETVTRGLGGLRMFAQLLPSLSVETSIGGNYERKGVDSYFPRTVFEGRNTDGLAIVSGSEFVNLVHEDLLRFEKLLQTDPALRSK